MTYSGDAIAFIVAEASALGFFFWGYSHYDKSGFNIFMWIGSIFTVINSVIILRSFYRYKKGIPNNDPDGDWEFTC